jgi:hypothetical protein
MEKNVNVWKANLTNGLILGLIGIVYTLTLYFLDLSFNKNLGYLFMVAQAVVLFFLIRSYRNNYLHGMITYGQAVGAGVIICLYYAIIATAFTMFLATVIDPNFFDKSIAVTEEMYLKQGLPQAQVDTMMNVARKMMKPAFMIPISLVSSMFFSTIMSLIVAAFVRKEGNPLIESTENQSE